MRAVEDKGKKASALTGFTIADIAVNIDLQEEEKERVDFANNKKMVILAALRLAMEGGFTWYG
eukprot:14382201-Ditylum_brightwellii.AAC.1